MPVRRFAIALSSQPAFIIAGAVAVATIISILTAVFLYQMRSDAMLRAQEFSENIALILERDIARNIEIYDLSMQAVIGGVKAPEVMALPSSIRQLVLFDRSSNARDLGALLVTDATGRVVIDSRSAPARPVQLGDRDYFQVHKRMADAGLFISKPFTPRVDGADTTIGLSRRLIDVDGKFTGIVVGTLRINYFKRLFEGVNVGPGGAITLLGDDGTVFMRRPMMGNAIGANAAKSANFARTQQARQGSFVAVAAMDGVKRLYTYRHVGGYPLMVSVGLATDDIYNNWRQRAWVISGIVAILNVLLFIISIFFAEQLRRRLEMEHQLKVLANTDGLTSLATRRAFDSALETEWRRADRHNQPLAFLMIDVDEFKLFNDRHGHAAGDAALRMVARCISDSIRRPGDIAGRYGGEEFCALLPSTDLVGALLVAGKIRAAIEAENEPHPFSKHGRVTVSIGIAIHSGDGRDAESAADCLRRADEYLYAAKAAGRNCVMPLEIQKRLAIL